jgi:hypothetical protein
MASVSPVCKSFRIGMVEVSPVNKVCQIGKAWEDSQIAEDSHFGKVYRLGKADDSQIGKVYRLGKEV